jgi:hypothetical protein
VLLGLAAAPLFDSDLFREARAVAGVVDCTEVLLGLAAAPLFDSNLAAGPRETLKLAVGRIVVTLVSG